VFICFTCRNIYEKFTRYIQDKVDYVFSSVKIYIENVVSIPINAFNWATNTAKQAWSTVLYPFEACFVVVTFVPMKILSFFVVKKQSADANATTHEECNIPSGSFYRKPGPLLTSSVEDVNQAINDVSREATNRSRISRENVARAYVGQGGSKNSSSILSVKSSRKQGKKTCCSKLLNCLQKPWDATEPIRYGRFTSDVY